MFHLLFLLVFEGGIHFVIIRSALDSFSEYVTLCDTVCFYLETCFCF